MGLTQVLTKDQFLEYLNESIRLSRALRTKLNNAWTEFERQMRSSDAVVAPQTYGECIQALFDALEETASGEGLAYRLYRGASYLKVGLEENAGIGLTIARYFPHTLDYFIQDSYLGDGRLRALQASSADCNCGFDVLLNIGDTFVIGQGEHTRAGDYGVALTVKSRASNYIIINGEWPAGNLAAPLDPDHTLTVTKFQNYA